MSEDMNIDPCESRDSTAYAIYKGGRLVAVWGEGFRQELMNHPEAKKLHEARLKALGELSETDQELGLYDESR